jgi:uncharacterized protein YndB with AHSA1/START domain
MTKIKELRINRSFDAPLEKVWKAWTDPKLLQQWWGPAGVTNPTCKWQAEAGGDIHIVMLTGESLGELAGTEWPMTGTFKEVEPMKKLVFTSNALRDGKAILTNLNTVTFSEKEGKTTMNLYVVVMMATPEAQFALKGMDMGWSQSIDKLAKFLR